MATLRDIPEVAGLDARTGLVRIPPEIDVPLTPRVRRILDTPGFRRLSRISQLGLVNLVYPSAHHTRMEHSLGVYRLSLLTLRSLAGDPHFRRLVAVEDAECFILAALLHDLGHWPFCHPIEDIDLADVPTHEQFAERFLNDRPIADALRTDWGIDPSHLLKLLCGRPESTAMRILQSLLSGPIDIDKMDYLMRDSLHAGVPYGRNFDQSRLVRNLCLNETRDGLAITDKGKTAAEMMVFARYVMFSEVYWHHGVRSATAMLLRAFYLLHGDLDLEVCFCLTEDQLIERLRVSAAQGPAAELLDGLFGTTRRLYKRLRQYSLYEQPEVYQRLVGRPYPWLVACAAEWARLAGDQIGRPVAPCEILIDAPPAHREVEFDLPVYFPKEDRYRPLGDISPVVRTLAREQFDDYVKRVRIFVHPRLANAWKTGDTIDRLVHQAVDGLT
ncbi:MAG: HD domain-containing protein [Pirellulales bacterium]